MIVCRNVFCNDSNPDLIDQNWINITDKLYIGMYAFRFDSSDEVTITCTAFVCPGSDGSQNCTQVRWKKINQTSCTVPLSIDITFR